MYDFYKNEILNFLGKYLFLNIFLSMMTIIYFLDYQHITQYNLLKLFKNDDFIQITILTNIFVLVLLFITTLNSFKYRKMIRVFDFHTKIKDKKYYDIVKKVDDDSVVFVNKVLKINYEDYEKNYEKLKQYLKLDYLQIRYQNNQVVLYVKDPFNTFKLKRLYLHKNKVFFGKDNEDNNIYQDINKLSHFLISGTSGSGKSVFVNNFLYSLFYNIDIIKYIFLVDFKGGLTFSKFSKINNKIKVFWTLEHFYKVIDFLEKENNKRMTYLRKNELEKYEKEPIFLFIDEYKEFIDIGNNLSDKKQKDKFKKYENKISRLTQTGRSQNIKINIITQKPDATSLNTVLRSNLQSRVMFKVQDIETIKMALGSSSLLETYNISFKDVLSFRSGHGLFLDFNTSKLYEFQSPFIDVNYEKLK